MTLKTLEGLFIQYNSEFKASPEEIAAWGTLIVDEDGLDPSTVVVDTSVGLFGADLSVFYDDCVALGELYRCRTLLDDYSGWGVGINWAPTAEVSED